MGRVMALVQARVAHRAHRNPVAEMDLAGHRQRHGRISYSNLEIFSIESRPELSSCGLLSP
jgi:hypothetical protein